MHLDFTPEQHALRRQIRDYYRTLFTPELRARARRRDPGVRRARLSARSCGRMGADGWLGIGWPKEYGGQGRTRARAVHLLRRDVPRAGAPLPCIAINTDRPDASCSSAPTAQKATLLPAILQRRAALRRSATPSPAPGTDLASLTHARRARRRRLRDRRPEGLHDATRRTPTTSGSPRAPIPTPRSTRASRSSSCPTEHARLLDARRSTRSAASARTRPTTRACACRVANRVGPEHEGWRLITSQLNHERITLVDAAASPTACSTRSGAGPRATAAPDGGRMLDEPWVQLDLRARLRQARGAEAPQLALGVVDHGAACPTWPRRRP